MKFFEKYSSNTLGASGNQTYFLTKNPNQTYKGRVFYKIFAGGKYNYSLLFSNIIDSTFADGRRCNANRINDEWTICSAKVSICKGDTDLSSFSSEDFIQLTFNGKAEKEVMPGEFFCSDEITLDANSGDYLCLETEYFGKEIPYFHEIMIPTFELRDGEWIQTPEVPIACMVGCDRAVKAKLGFLGDSITEGIGVPSNSYLHWASKIAEALGTDYSFWNLGIGFGRADDAATDGAWLFKAKQLDAVTVCYGVNDISQGYTAEDVIKSITKILRKLSEANVRVILFTVPPFDQTGDKLEKWRKVNSFIKENTPSGAAEIFDTVPILGSETPNEQNAKYGGHPNAEGCTELAKHFTNKIKFI